MSGLTRRAALAAAGGGTVALGLAACTPTNGQAPGDAGDASGVKPTRVAGGKSAIAASEVPLGGSVIVQTGSESDPAIAVAQPAKGRFVAHTAVCTHQGCIVGAAGKELHCPCHGSRYDAFTGKVLQGPARLPLDAVPVSVDGDHVEFSA
jgi:Rieske Fe-S protein